MQLGSRFSFWIKTQKKKNVKCFPLVPNPRGGVGVSFSVSPPKCAFLEQEVKNEG